MSTRMRAAHLGLWAMALVCGDAAFAQNGSIVAWGENVAGRCNVPSPNTGFVAIAAGWSHGMGLRNDGRIVCWGSNAYGQCNVPAPNGEFVAVAAGYGHSLALKSDGSIAAWGLNNYGQCNLPQPNSGFVKLAAGDYHNLALKVDGSLVAWGSNSVGQCNIPAPNSGFVAVAAGDSDSLGLRGSGSIEAWGYWIYGQLNVPAPNTDFVALTAGFVHNLALKCDSSIVAWEWNNSGQCNVPAPNVGFVGIAAGSNHSLGLKADGSVIAWGSNSFGQCAVPAPNTHFVALAARDDYSLGLIGRAAGSSNAPPTSVPAFRLTTFPLPGLGPYTADIASVFDHAMHERYCPEASLGRPIVAFTGEAGTILDCLEPRLKSNCSGEWLYSYKQDAQGTPFVINGHYLGTTTTGPGTLNYDGHAGYDYPCLNDTEVRAAAGGTVVLAHSQNDSPNGKRITIQYGDFQTVYLHLNSVGVLINQVVVAGQPIGASGDTDGHNPPDVSQISPHLHFEVRRKISRSWYSVDPYGWTGLPGEDPYPYRVESLWDVP